MKKDILIKVKIPEGISTKISEDYIIFSKQNHEIKRRLNKLVNLKIEGDEIIIESKKSGKNKKKIAGALEAHIKNMIKGLEEKFLYKLQIVSVHFPITSSIDKGTNELVIKNFLGEKIDRRMKIMPNTEVKIDKDIITIESFDKEAAGQTAANFEKGSKIRFRDRRIFQDGIYITEKPGRVM
ncbi:MAG: 50S ribosomal protein L6 [Candidatus Nanoarchaeia archaeon]